MHDKYSHLDIDDFHKVLRHIGFTCLKIQKIEFSKDQLLSVIFQAKEFCSGLEFKESDFLKDIISTVPLFTKDGIYYRWSHKSLQEYFAAQFIYLDAKLSQEKILEKISANDTDKYYNVLDIYYDIDYKSFRDVIIRKLLIDFKRHSEILKSNFTTVPERGFTQFIELTFPSLCNILISHKTIDNTTNRKNDFIRREYEKQNNCHNTDQALKLVIDRKGNYVYSLQFFESNRINIIAILRTKGNEIIKYISFGEDRTELEKYSRHLTEKAPLIIDQNTENILIKENLNDINKLLSQSLVFQSTLSYVNAMNMLETIEKEKSIRESTDYLLNGLT